MGEQKWAKLFRSPAEVESACRLDPDWALPHDQLQYLLGQTEFRKDDWQECQLLRVGSRCGKPHGDGWVAIAKDGRGVYIGGDCAKNHFSQYIGLSEEVNRARRQIRIDEIIERISEMLRDPGYQPRLERAIDGCARLRDRIASARERWPVTVINRLSEMAKTGNSTLDLRIRYMERNDEGKMVANWRAARGPSIASPEAIYATPCKQLSEQLEQIRVDLREAKPSRDFQIKTLQAWSKSLGGLSGCEGSLAQMLESIDRFERPDNLKLLVWTVRSERDQLDVVREVLRSTGQADAPPDVVQRTLIGWRDEVRAAHQGNDFRFD